MRGGGRISSLGAVSGLTFVRADKDGDGDFDPLTSTSWDGDSFSTSTGTINWNTAFGVPTTAKAVLLQAVIRDSGGAKTGIVQLFAKSTTTLCAAEAYTDIGGDVWNRYTLVTPIAADGTSYRAVTASGVNTCDIHLRVIGWYL